MINTEKVRLMTQVTNYEKSGGEKEIKMNRYQQSTYVGLQLLKTFVLTSIVFVFIAVLAASYLVLEVVNKGQTAVIGEVCLEFLVLYAISLGIALLVTWFEQRKRYRTMQKHIQVYDKKLRRLEKYFEEEGKE